MDETTHNNALASNGSAGETGSSSTPEQVEEISFSPERPLAPVVTPAVKRDEPDPNPLLDDPYEWERCTITIICSLLPGGRVTISVHNHRDEPIIRDFAATDVPLPEKIHSLTTRLQELWPANTILVTVVLLPRSSAEAERATSVAVRAGTDTPILWAGSASDLLLPAAILGMLEELRAQLPSRALKRLEKEARTRTIAAARQNGKSSPKPAHTPAAPPQALDKNQLSLF